MRETDDEQRRPVDPVDLLAAWQTRRDAPTAGRRARPSDDGGAVDPAPVASYEPGSVLGSVWRPPDTDEIDALWPDETAPSTPSTAFAPRTSAAPDPRDAPAGSGVSTTDVVFKPRVWGHRLMGLILVLVGTGAALACLVAVQEPTTDRVGIAGALVVLTLAVWGIRASAPVTRLALRSGQLEMRRGGRRQVIELQSVRTPVLIEGTPGRRDWRVRLGLPGESPWVVDDSMVDPHVFTEALLRLRPELRPTVLGEQPGRD